MATEVFDITRVGGSIGAEIHGIDLSRDLLDETVAAIRRALLDHLVVFFRDQHLTSAAYRAFAARIGRPIDYQGTAQSPIWNVGGCGANTVGGQAAGAGG